MLLEHSQVITADSKTITERKNKEKKQNWADWMDQCSFSAITHLCFYEKTSTLNEPGEPALFGLLERLPDFQKKLNQQKAKRKEYLLS